MANGKVKGDKKGRKKPSYAQKAQSSESDFLTEHLKKTHKLELKPSREDSEVSSVILGLNELRKIEEILKYKNITSEAMTSHLSEGVIFLNKEQKVMRINKAAIEMLGLKSSKEILSRHHDGFITLQDKLGNVVTEDKNPILQTFKKKREVILRITDNYYCVKKSGNPFPVVVNTRPIRMGNKFMGIVLILHDAVKEQKINEIKSDFVSIASHQLRTPITVSKLHTDMLLQGEYGRLTSAQRKAIEEIDFYNQKMRDILTDFLTVSKLEMNDVNPRFTTTSIAMVLNDVLRELTPEIKLRKLKCKKIFDPRVKDVLNDPSLLRIVCHNIISNAIKYTNNGGKLFVSTEKHEKSVLVTVRDTGYGIPENEKPYIFTKLYRTSTAKKLHHNGTGLGLYIAKSIADRCGINMWFDSIIEKGTTFYLDIPFLPANAKK